MPDNPVTTEELDKWAEKYNPNRNPSPRIRTTGQLDAANAESAVRGFHATALRVVQDPEAAAVIAAVAAREGGLSGGIGDQRRARGRLISGSYGPLQFRWHEDPNQSGQLTAFAQRLGVSIEEAKRIAQQDPEKVLQFAWDGGKGYLAQAIQQGRQNGKRGAELASFVSEFGQKSVSPRRSADMYNQYFSSPEKLISTSDIDRWQSGHAGPRTVNGKQVFPLVLQGQAITPDTRWVTEDHFHLIQRHLAGLNKDDPAFQNQMLAMLTQPRSLNPATATPEDWLAEGANLHPLYRSARNLVSVVTGPEMATSIGDGVKRTLVGGLVLTAEMIKAVASVPFAAAYAAGEAVGSAINPNRGRILNPLAEIVRPLTEQAWVQAMGEQTGVMHRSFIERVGGIDAWEKAQTITGSAAQGTSELKPDEIAAYNASIKEFADLYRKDPDLASNKKGHEIAENVATQLLLSMPVLQPLSRAGGAVLKMGTNELKALVKNTVTAAGSEEVKLAGKLLHTVPDLLTAPSSELEQGVHPTAILRGVALPVDQAIERGWAVKRLEAGIKGEIPAPEFPLRVTAEGKLEAAMPGKVFKSSFYLEDAEGNLSRAEVLVPPAPKGGVIGQYPYLMVSGDGRAYRVNIWKAPAGSVSEEIGMFSRAVHEAPGLEDSVLNSFPMLDKNGRPVNMLDRIRGIGFSRASSYLERHGPAGGLLASKANAVVRDVAQFTGHGYADLLENWFHVDKPLNFARKQLDNLGPVMRQGAKAIDETVTTLGNFLRHDLDTTLKEYAIKNNIPFLVSAERADDTVLNRLVQNRVPQGQIPGAAGGQQALFQMPAAAAGREQSLQMLKQLGVLDKQENLTITAQELFDHFREKNYVPRWINYQALAEASTSKDPTRWNEAINALVTSKQAPSKAQAANILHNMINEAGMPKQAVHFPGQSWVNAERPSMPFQIERVLPELPAWVYHDPFESWMRLRSEMSTLTSQSKHFGAKGEILEELLNGAKSFPGADTKFLDDAVKSFFGRRMDDEVVKNFVRAASNLNVFTKMAMSTISRTGHLSTIYGVEGTKNVLGGIKASSEFGYLDAVRYGAMVSPTRLLNNMMTMPGKLATGLLANTRFFAVDSWLRNTAFEGGRFVFDDIRDILGNSGASAKARGWAERFATQAGLNPKGLVGLAGDELEHARGNFGYYVSQISQGRGSVLDNALWMQSPGGRLVMNMRGFLYNQAAFTTKHLVGEVMHGNFTPMIRFLGAALPHGAAILAARALIPAMLTGQIRSWDDVQKTVEAKLKHNIATPVGLAATWLDAAIAVGGFGLISEVPYRLMHARDKEAFTEGMKELVGVPVSTGVELLTTGLAAPMLRTAQWALGDEASASRSVLGAFSGIAEGELENKSLGEKMLMASQRLAAPWLRQVPAVGPSLPRLLPGTMDVKTKGRYYDRLITEAVVRGDSDSAEYWNTKRIGATGQSISDTALGHAYDKRYALANRGILYQPIHAPTYGR